MFFDDLLLHQEYTTESVTIREDKMIAFAKEYDPFPLHFDKEFAAKTRYGKLIAPGVMTFMSIWAKVMELGFLGDELVAGRSTKIEWFKPVFADDVLTGKVTITRLERRNQFNGIAELTTDVYNQNGVLVLRDVTESVLRCRGN